MPNTTISSAAVNSDFSDIATALTQSVSADGQTPLTGVFKFIVGALATPSITFSSNTTAGLYSPATNQLGLVANSLGELINGTAFAANSIAVAGGGNNYNNGDQVTLAGGTFISPATVQVTSNSGGVITGISVVNPGRYTAQAGTLTQASTTGSGTGATFTPTWTTSLALTDLNGNALWTALGATSFFANNIVNANTLTQFVGSQTIQAFNLGTTAQGYNAPLNLQIGVTNPSNALTVNVLTANGSTPTVSNPVLIALRDPTVANGDPVIMVVTSALTVATPTSGATFGVTNITSPISGTGQTPFRLWIVCFNAGSAVSPSPALGLWQSTSMSSFAISASNNMLLPTGISSLAENTLQTTSAISSPTNAGTFYTASILTSKPFRILGYIEYGSGLSTAGTFTTTPTRIQLFGPGIEKPGQQVQLFTNQVTTLVNCSLSTISYASSTSVGLVLSSVGGVTGMSQAITPTFAGNLLEVQSVAVLGGATSNGNLQMLFQDPLATGTPALSVSTFSITTGAASQASFLYRLIAGTISSTTLKMNYGPTSSVAIALNGFNNGSGNTQVLNGSQANSNMTVKEIMV